MVILFCFHPSVHLCCWLGKRKNIRPVIVAVLTQQLWSNCSKKGQLIPSVIRFCLGIFKAFSAYKVDAGGYIFCTPLSMLLCVKLSDSICFCDTSSIYWWIFAELLSLMHLGTKMNWLGFGVKMSKSHYCWKPRSVFSTSWRQSSIAHWTAWRHTTWLQTYDVCLTCLLDDVCGHHWPISSMSASRSVQLLETELSLSPVLDYRTVCRQTLSRVTLCRGSGENLKHFSSHNHIPPFWFSFFPSWSLRFLLRPR